MINVMDVICALLQRFDDVDSNSYWMIVSLQPSSHSLNLRSCGQVSILVIVEWRVCSRIFLPCSLILIDKRMTETCEDLYVIVQYPLEFHQENDVQRTFVSLGRLNHQVVRVKLHFINLCSGNKRSCLWNKIERYLHSLCLTRCSSSDFKWLMPTNIFDFCFYSSIFEHRTDWQCL